MNLFDPTVSQEKATGNDTLFPQETYVSTLPVFDVLQKKHIPSKNAEIFGAEFFRLQPTTPDANTRTLVKKNLSTNFEKPATYDAISNKELFPIQEFKLTQIPIIDRSKDYVAYKEVVGNSIYQIWKPQPHITSTDWVTVTIIGILLLIGYARISHGNIFSPVFQSAFILNQASRIYFEKSVLISRLFGILDFLFVITLGLLLTLTANYYGISIVKLPYWAHFFIFLGIVLLLSAIKTALNRTIGYILNISDVVSEIVFHSNLYIKLTALVFLPFVAILPYVSHQVVEPLLIVLLFTITAIYLLRLIRLTQITTAKKISNFYLFLYLCSVEIGPLLVILSHFRQFL